MFSIFIEEKFKKFFKNKGAEIGADQAVLGLGLFRTNRLLKNYFPMHCFSCLVEN